MGRNDEGEFELVLGNKQLLSVLTILVILLGLFFLMGYVIGRGNPRPDAITAAMNSGAMPSSATSTIVDPSTAQRIEDPTGDARKIVEANLAKAGGNVPATSQPATPPVIETSKPSPLDDSPEAKKAAKEAAALLAKQQKEEEAKKRELEKAQRAEEKKAAELAKAEEKKAAELAKAEEKKRLAEEKKKRPTDPPGNAPITPSSPGEAPPSGIYWQVAAIDKAGAKILSDSLRRRSINAYSPKVENKDLYRVIVGPLKDKAEIVSMRDSLEKLGFKDPMQKKY